MHVPIQDDRVTTLHLYVTFHGARPLRHGDVELLRRFIRTLLAPSAITLLFPSCALTFVALIGCDYGI